MYTDKVTLVTGAASGIGRSIAQLFAENGAKVVVTDVDVEGGEETVELIQSVQGKATFVKTDVFSPEDCERMVQQTLGIYGSLHCACNNAGIPGEENPTADYSIEGWQKLLSINLSGVFYCMKYEIPAMLQGEGGSIVNIASILGRVAFPGAPAYVSAKHGVVGLTENAALEYGSQGIRVNAVGPGFIRTPMISQVVDEPEMEEQLIGLHPIGRLGEPEEVAELVLWLCSEKASFVTGAYYPIDGGYLAR